MLAINDWMKNLDKQVLYMEKTDQVLIDKMNEAGKEKKEIIKKEAASKAYYEKLAKIRQEEKRHLQAAKKVPRTF